ncbi:hypothetical protein [Nonomuraea solani]|uniref:hypothetical protein n=1 Tax=Nonomuraea solani TaxID=1144553 RepID=UPI0011B0053A|nr:hypothetical protein [Nonomuraea solani]
MADREDAAPRGAAGRSLRWLPRVILPPVAVLITIGMYDRRGVVMAIVAAITYGTLAALSWLPAERLTRWSREHPMIDGLFFAPLLFAGLAYLTSLSLLICLVIAAIGTVLLLGVIWWRRRPVTRSE